MQIDDKRTRPAAFTLVSAFLAFFLASVVTGGSAHPASADELVSSAPANALVYFITPLDGQQLKSPFTVRFGLRGMGVAPAGVERAGTGHHHLLIDLDKMPDPGKPLPASEQIRHFGKGQTETEISLSPGVHKLQLVLGNHLHIPHKPPLLSQEIMIVVLEPAVE